MTALLALTMILSQAPEGIGEYELDTSASTAKLKAGEKGKVVIDIRARGGAHISDEAPLKIELKGTGATVEKDKLVYKDSTAKKKDGQTFADPHFEVAFTAPAAGKASIEAKMKFFVCNDKVCAPQNKTVTLPVEVN